MEINIVLTTTPTRMQTITIYESPPKEYTPFNIRDTILINCTCTCSHVFIGITKITRLAQLHDLSIDYLDSNII